ncbi:Cucumisin precursor, putative [Ricinus communis]|uniref:Cucumisin, putative n=1 Tax=Ricinus communis TaxID=3988 RepID=B9SE32_RICCO|nr:Cucumisin precursor, putative [Ricinus communis]
MGDHLKGDISSSSALHISMLQEVVGSDGSDSLIYSYKRSFNGFAAKLTNEEMLKLAGMEGVVSVFPSEKKRLHTTRSWDFMSFSKHVRRSTVLESNIIIGMLDTGIWPESESFSDEDFGPPPTKWKGICQESSNFTCNNKIIGARYYRSDGYFGPDDIVSPRDSEGHGSHTSSAAAGNLIHHASMDGLGSGTARGGVPSARIAVYKICWSDGCYDADILAAFDDAIDDGVDIISISVGGFSAKDYFNDSIAIGAFHAMKHGILTSASAGNSGPYPATMSNYAPWFLSVAASTIDRKFFTKVKLGNGDTYEGVSINTFNLNHKMYPVIYGGNAPDIDKGFNESVSRYCIKNSLDKTLVKGKIVLCDYISSGETQLVAEAIGTIMQDGYYQDAAYNFPLPASHLNLDDGFEVSEYVNRTRKPTATIFKSIEKKDKLAPYVVSFSSRGPNPITKDILTPDIAAPGIDILAAWTEGNSITGFIGDDRVLPFNIISGTSMACPHATAAAAYIKSFNPTWSPAALKSALMTTECAYGMYELTGASFSLLLLAAAFPMSPETNPEAEFAYGAGHLNPVKAINPGLVYDAGENQFIQFLCGQGYTTKQLRLVAGDNSSCSKVPKTTSSDLNLPSFTLSALSGQSVGRVFHRTVTNVGSAVSSYKAIVNAPKGLKINVTPDVLSFKNLGEQKTFIVTVIAKMGYASISGSLSWDDGEHQVRSPILAYVSS